MTTATELAVTSSPALFVAAPASGEGKTTDTASYVHFHSPTNPSAVAGSFAA